MSKLFYLKTIKNHTNTCYTNIKVQLRGAS